MSISNRTYRMLEDGSRIEGTWRHVFIKNGSTFYLSDLKIYADGLIDCWGLVDLEGFREKVAQGWVATEPPDGAQAVAYNLSTWEFKDPEGLPVSLLVAEVEDTMAELQGRPTSSERFAALLDEFLLDPSDANRPTLREAYLAIPEHMRRFVLHDQDMKDWPAQILAGDLGDLVPSLDPPFDQVPITEEDRTRALDYLAFRKAARASRPEPTKGAGSQDRGQ